MIVLDGSQRMQADYDEGEYRKFLNPNFLGRQVAVVLNDDEYMQVNPIDFEINKLGRFWNDILLRRRRAQAEIYFSNAGRMLDADSLLAADSEIQKSLQVVPRYQAYLLRVKILKALLDADRDSNGIHGWANNLKYDTTVDGFSGSQRFRLFFELGTAVASQNDATEDALYDLAVEAFDAAISARPNFSEPYQEKYRLQARAGDQLDASATIADFFNRNPGESRQRIVRRFLLDWLDAIHRATGFPAQLGTYVAKCRAAPTSLAMWSDFSEVADRYAHLFEHKADENQTRLWQGYQLAQRVLEEGQ